MKPRSSRTPAFSGTAGCFTHYFADYNLLSFMVWLQDHSDSTGFSSYSPFPLPVVPPFLVATALQLSGAGYPCSHHLLLFFRWLPPRYSLFISWLLFPPPHFISVYWRVLCMQSSFYRLGPNCVSEHTEAIFPCNKYTSRDASIRLESCPRCVFNKHEKKILSHPTTFPSGYKVFLLSLSFKTA